MDSINLGIVTVSVVSGLLVGLPAGAAGALAFLSRLNASKSAKDSTEELLAKQVPPETVREINQIANRALDVMDRMFDAIRQGAMFIRDVTDGKPNMVEVPPQEVVQGTTPR